MDNYYIIYEIGSNSKFNNSISCLKFLESSMKQFEECIEMKLRKDALGNRAIRVSERAEHFEPKASSLDLGIPIENIRFSIEIYGEKGNIISITQKSQNQYKVFIENRNEGYLVKINDDEYLIRR